MERFKLDRISIRVGLLGASVCLRETADASNSCSDHAMPWITRLS